MKKTVLAAAAVAALSGSAFAQSSVTLYGVVDASLESVKGDDSVTRVTSDNYASSRLGFRGVEDLGGGLKAKFVLEAGLRVDTGAQNNGARFFDRSSWVGAEGGFGELRLGRQDSSIGALAGNTNILGAQNYDDLKIARTFAGDGYRRLDNAITYILPTFAPGLSAQLQYSTRAGTSAVVGAETADDDTDKAFGLSVQYAGGPFGAGLGYIKAKQDVEGDNEGQGLLVYGSYDFGAAKLTAYYNVDDSELREAALGDAYDKREVYGLKVGVPFGTNFSLTAGVSKVDAVNFVTDNEATIVAVKGVYNLSKRTALYGLVTHISNDNGSRLTISGGPELTANDKNTHGIAFGVRHTF